MRGLGRSTKILATNDGIRLEESLSRDNTRSPHNRDTFFAGAGERERFPRSKVATLTQLFLAVRTLGKIDVRDEPRSRQNHGKKTIADQGLRQPRMGTIATFGSSGEIP